MLALGPAVGTNPHEIIVSDARTQPASDTGGDHTPLPLPPRGGGVQVVLPGGGRPLVLPGYVVLSVEVVLHPLHDPSHPGPVFEQRYTITVRNPSADPAHLVKQLLFAEQQQPEPNQPAVHLQPFRIHLVDLPAPLGPGQQGSVTGTLPAVRYPSTIWVLGPAIAQP